SENTSGRSFGVNKRKAARIETSLAESGFYDVKRREFDPEYDTDAEKLLADMEFKDNDTEEECELKMRVLRIYSKRLDERKRRKDFILERDLLILNPFRKDLSGEEKEICQRYDVFMRFHSKVEHEELIEAAVSEHRILKRIRELKEARAAGCRSSSEANRYLEQKRRESENGAAAHPMDPQIGQESVSLRVSSDSFGTFTNSASANSILQSDMDFVFVSAANLLSEYEKQLCLEMKLHPNLYLKMQEDLATQIMCGNITKKSEAHSFFQIEPVKVDKVYDMLLKKGIVQQ
ncbi:hypothetical protein M569_02798, partial [Genlisea aurea]